MIIKNPAIHICLFILGFMLSSPGPIRPADSPIADFYHYFPQPPQLQPGDTLFVIEIGAMNHAELLLISTLAGAVAQNQPAIFIRLGNGYLKWQADLEQIYGLVMDLTYQHDPWGLFSRFKNQLAEPAYLLCDLQPSSMNVATSLSGIWHLVAVDAGIEAQVQAQGLQLKLDVRGKDEDWCFRNYWQEFNPGLLIQQKESLMSLRDYAALAGAFTFYDGNSALMHKVMNAAAADAPVLGWGDAAQGEDQFIRPGSENSLFTVPADHAWNLSVFSGVKADSLYQRTHTETLPAIDSVHTVTFVMSDGDNIQWIMNDFTVNENWFGNPLRGQFDMGWTISPALVALAPTILDRVYRDAATGPGRDFFVCGVSGGGYFYPSYYADLGTHCDRLNSYMQAADLNIVTILESRRGFFTPEILDNYTRQSQIIGCFYLDYAQYDYYAGKIVWSNGKPVVSAKFNLWHTFDTPEYIASMINRLPRNPAEATAYSFVNVHPWSRSLDDVRRTIEIFNEHIQVVTPEAFIQRIVAKVPHGSAGVSGNYSSIPKSLEFEIYPNPVRDDAPETSIRIHLKNKNPGAPIQLQIFDVLGREIYRSNLTGQKGHQYHSSWNGNDQNGARVTAGVYFVRVTANSEVALRKLVVLRWPWIED